MDLSQFAFEEINLSMLSWPTLLTMSFIIGAMGCKYHSLRTPNSTKNGKKQRKRRMTGIGLSSLISEVETNLSIGSSISILNGPISVENVIERFRERMLTGAMHERFRCRVENGNFIEIDDYDPSVNVTRVTLDKNETPYDFCEQVTNTPLNPHLPLWQVYVIEEYDGKAFILWRAHHCIGDGMSMVAAIAKLTDNSEDLEKLMKSAKKSSTSKPKISIWKKIFQSLSLLFQLIFVCLWSLWVVHRKLFTTVFLNEPKTILKRPGGKRKRLRYIQGFKVNEIKTIGKKFGGTLNDVVLSCVIGAVNTIFKKHDPSFAYEDLKLRVAIPVDMRSSSTEIKSTRNQFSSLLVSLPVGITDGIKRLKYVTKEMNEAKGCFEKQFTYFFGHVIGKIPDFILKPLVGFMTRNISIACTNVRGPPLTLSLCGREIITSVPFVPPPPGVNLGIAIFSVGEDLFITVSMDEKTLENPDEYCDAVKNEIYKLKKLEQKHE